MQYERAGRSVLGALVWLTAAPASAFCRTTTVEPESTCPEVCSLAGIPLHWDTPEHSFSLNVPSFPELSEGDTRRIIGRSFATWQGVQCNGRPVDFRFSLAAVPTNEGAVHRVGGGNLSVLAYEDAPTWAALDHSPSAFAVTTLAYLPSSGVITETDIEFNGGMPSWAECPVDGCASGVLRTDLENVLTHELGHTLGLAHSDVDAATMSCSASPSDTDKRSLDVDDAVAICGTYPPGASFGPEASVLVQGVTCAAAAAPGVPRPGVVGWLGGASLLVLLARARRGSRRAPNRPDSRDS